MDERRLNELLQRAGRADPNALSELVAAYSGRVYGLLFQLTGSRDAADDLLQETFLRVVRMIGEYQHDGRFDGWLFRIAANLARDRARQLRRRGATAGLESAEIESRMLDTPAADEPATCVARGEDADRLRSALRRLTSAEREILLLRHYSELSFRDIAELLDVPLGTALARAHRALQRLRGEFGVEPGAGVTRADRRSSPGDV
ncbi:MAG: RNA polymerase sigma factor [Phycisphaerae bacterium]